MKHIKPILLLLLLLMAFSSGCTNNMVNNPSNTESNIYESNSESSKSESSNTSDTSNNKEYINETMTDKSKLKYLPKSHKILDFEIIAQLPELPTGCEITALTMVLNYYNLNPDKMEMATKYLPTTRYYTYYKSYQLTGPDLNNYFLGDPQSVYGYVCGTGAIITAANGFLSDINAPYTARDLTGSDVMDLYKYVSEDKPIVVWTTIEMADRYETEGWYTENGDYVDWSQNDHCSVLIGYSDNTVTIADPILGEIDYERKQFEKVLASRGSKCAALFNTSEKQPNS